MKLLFLLISTVIIVAFSSTSSFGRADRDSAIARSVRVMRYTLSLTGEEEMAVVQLKRVQYQLLDNLGQNKSLNVQERGRELMKLLLSYNQKMKNLLTQAQWEKYVEMEAAAKEAFKNSVKDKKIMVRELSD
jgi:hypothetical protein